MIEAPADLLLTENNWIPFRVQTVAISRRSAFKTYLADHVLPFLPKSLVVPTWVLSPIECYIPAIPTMLFGSSAQYARYRSGSRLTSSV